MAVHRVRPRGDDEDSACSDDMVSDEELEVTHGSIEAALKTKLGGREREGDDDDGAVGSHQENSASGMDLAKALWMPESCEGPDIDTAHKTNASCLGLSEAEMKAVLGESRKSQKQEKSLSGTVREAEEREASLRSLTSATADDVQQWLDTLKERRNTEGRLKGRLVCNPEQFAAVEMVAKRVMRELCAESHGESDYGEPLRWVFHGGPGTGKSHVIKVIKEELFEGVLKWDLGVKFQVVALQAVMAQLLGGDTIHHALGIPVFKGKEVHGDDLQKHMDVAKRVLQWRWLIIDEISMVSAKLFAETYMKLRQVVRDVGTSKKDQGIDRPFGRSEHNLQW